MWKREKMIHGKMIYSLLLLPLLAFFSLFWHSDSYALTSSGSLDSSHSSYFFCNNSTECSSYISGFYVHLSNSFDVSSFSSSDWSTLSNFVINFRFLAPSYSSSTISTVFRVFQSDIYFYVPSFSDLNSFGFTYANYNSNVASVFGSDWSISISISDSPFFNNSTPSGTISITENGIFDVTNYSQAVVDVPPEIIYPTYHDDLIDIKNVILLVPAVLLLIYFFYCIYRIIIVNTRR